MSITLDVQIDGAMWILIARDGEKNLFAYSNNILSNAVKNMEFKYKIAVKLPSQFESYSEATAEEYRRSTEKQAAD